MFILSGKGWVHHRNPSGLHNKVNWLLSESHWDKNRLVELSKRILITLNNASWVRALSIADGIIRNDKFTAVVYRACNGITWVDEYFKEKKETMEVEE